jgi:nucleotide-binding universal stress UspA family protein
MSTIVVGVDDSTRSRDAVALARRLGAERVIAAHAFPYDDAPNRAANLVYRKALEGAETLVERSRGLDLLVAGSRGYGPLRGVSGRLSREAHCPVIVVPRGVEARLFS